MKVVILAILACVAMVSPSRAQSFPNWQQKDIPTVQEWRQWWATKPDTNGDGANLTWDNCTLPDLLGKKVDMSSGSSTNQALTTPAITGGTSNAQSLRMPVITGGSLSGTAASAASVIGPDATAVSRSVQSKEYDRSSVKDFGAKGDGATNDDAAIQTALTALCARTAGKGGELYFPSGDYVISAATGHSVPCAGVSIRGAGGGAVQAGGTRFLVTGTGSVALFDFDAPVVSGDRYFYGGRMTDVAFMFANTTASVTQKGPAVKFTHCAGCVADHVYSYGAYNLFEAYSGFKNRFREFYATQMMSSVALGGGYAVYYHGDETGANCASDIGSCPTRGDVTEVLDFHVDEALSSSTGFVPGSCVHISDFAATTWIAHGTCNQVHIALNIDCPTSTSAAACPQFIHLDRLEAEINATGDAAGSTCISGTDVTHLEAYSFQCYGYNEPTNLIRFITSGKFPSIGHVEFYGGKVEGAAEACVSYAAKDFRFIGGDIIGCNQDGATYSATNSTFGILLQAAADGNSADGGSFVVNGVNFCDGATSAAAPFGAVRIDSGVSYGTITGNIFRGCAAGVADNSGETVNVVANNSGP
ncbi:glycoside hydrolase family 55 protein [Gluconacetobacter entanii]|uniref:Glycoside hydrolase family 55 protein n=1 Tax=Gluconacetobacter entanii TaxID=108528 RepID=A0ABT3K7E4_9PROT|nr:glycoside hydrolase family 55 protein [Gluconacetobacter entanii]MCW4591320.1 glycoside hydrolase family 55 protein [Gluconacetobacter entanii]MCW4595562.1 glycoside hydrolase family 55 protein [Gluconacetobacter entanii]